MRTLVDIPDRQLDDLVITYQAKRISRAEASRRQWTTGIEQNFHCCITPELPNILPGGSEATIGRHLCAE